MPILADALQDAGCENEDILTHCRRPGRTSAGAGSWTWCSGRRDRRLTENESGRRPVPKRTVGKKEGQSWTQSQIARWYVCIQTALAFQFAFSLGGRFRIRQAIGVVRFPVKDCDCGQVQTPSLASTLGKPCCWVCGLSERCLRLRWNEEQSFTGLMVRMPSTPESSLGTSVVARRLLDKRPGRPDTRQRLIR